MKKSYSAFLPAVLFFIISFPLFSQATDFTEAQTRTFRENLVRHAKDTLGKSYEKGKRGAETFDEAGFINFCYASVVEIFVPVTVRSLYDYSKIVPEEEREIGDIIFFQRESSMADAGLYIGNGEFIACTQSNGNSSVKTFKLSEKYWKENYLATGKILNASGMTDKNSKSAKTTQKKTTKTKEKTAPETQVQIAQTENETEPEQTDEAETENTEEKPFQDKIFFTNFITGDWSLFTENRFMINFRGLSAQSIVNYKTDNLTFGTGFMLRWNHGVGAFQLPLLFSVDIFDFIKVYSGPVFTIGSCYTPITKTPVEASIFPGILGVTFYLPSITKGDFKVQFIQDINFSVFNHADGSALPIDQTLTSGLELSTGISVTFPLSIFIY